MVDSSATQSPVNYVHILNSTTFKPFIEFMGMVLLSVVMLPISSRCQIFAPEFRKIANVMHSSGISFAQIDALENGDVCAPFEIRSYPDVMLFQGYQNVLTYHGAHKAVDIVAYLNRFLHFPVLSILSSESLAAFTKSSAVVIVAYIATNDAGSREIYTTLAKLMHPEFVFGITNDSSLLQAGQTNLPVAVYKSFGEELKFVHLVDDNHKMAMSLRKAAQPLIIDLTIELHEDFLDIGTPLGYVFAHASEHLALHRVLEPLAQKYRHKIQFGIADPGIFADIIDDLHLKPDRLPAFAIREPEKNLRFPMDRYTTPFEHALEDFVQDYVGGKLQPTVKSEPIPPKSDDVLIKVVALNYEHVVMDRTKDVFLEYCITPCGPCDALRPTFQALARLYASNSTLKEKVTIGTIAYDANDVPERAVMAFPTLKLFPANSKDSPITYLGTTTLEDMSNFIFEHGDNKARLREQVEKYTSSTVVRSQDVCFAGGDCSSTAKATVIGHEEL